jgi:hypothetical protein
MTTTTPIPQSTLPVGTTFVGPFDIPPGTTGFSVVIDRTPTGGLNELDDTTTFEMTIQSSPDGVTWNNEGGATTSGGIFTDHHGQVNANMLSVGGMNPDATMVGALITVGGPVEVVIAGSVTTVP